MDKVHKPITTQDLYPLHESWKGALPSLHMKLRRVKKFVKALQKLVEVP
jgi:hypothetical protein